jgi:hypothetical protein
MRLVASQVRVENGEGAIWWMFLVAVYMPVTVLLAWPMARFLGLIPESMRSRPPATQPAIEREEAFAPAGAQ